jgi:REP element-mobilizing transposase RayT
MPRKARIDAPGTVQHIICRGIERSLIFKDDQDRENFLKRLDTILEQTCTPCYAWALIPNHFHLLLRTGNTSISTVMRRLLTGYAVSFNLRHRRSGHLFQNRFKSILCQEDIYLKQLIAYIHLNPLRAGLVSSFKSLADYPYGGHSAIMGYVEREFQDVDFILNLFGGEESLARDSYESYVRNAAAIGRRSELVGGGLIRSEGGWGALKAARKARFHLKGDERILGESDFVEKVLSMNKERFERRYWLKSKGYDFDWLVKQAAERLGLDTMEILKPGKQPLRSRARSLVCYWAVKDLGMSATHVGRLLNLSQSAVSRAVARGEGFADEMKLDLIDRYA